MEAVGDGLGDAGVEAADLDPLLLVDAGFLIDEIADALGVPVAGEAGPQRLGVLTDAGREGDDAVRGGQGGPGASR